jgi:thiamine kinase-like enzyme
LPRVLEEIQISIFGTGIPLYELNYYLCEQYYEMRNEALAWFKKLSESEFEKVVREWKLKTNHFAKDWSVWMISRSSSVIEIIYKETQVNVS